MKRLAAAVELGVVIGFAVLVPACSPSPGSSPVPGGDPGPETGGQTGDPGVSSMEHVSGVARPGGPSAGSCGSTERTDVPRTAAVRWPSITDDSVLVLEATPGDPRVLLVADFAFGLRVVDASRSDALRAGPALELDSPPLQLDRLPDGRFLVLARGEALLVSITGDAPSVLARVAIAGRPRSSHVITFESGPRMHVVVDSYLEDEDWAHPCPLRRGTAILRYDLSGAGFAETSAIDLGDSVQAVRFDGDRGLVVTTEGRFEGRLRPSGVQWLELAQDDPRPGPRTELGGALSAASEIRMVGDTLEALVLHLGEPRAELVRFDASDPDAMIALRGCELPLQARDEVLGDDPDGLYTHRSLFTAAGLVVRDANPERDGVSQTGRLVRVGDAECELQELALPAAAELLPGPSGTLLALGGAPHEDSGEGGPLEIALYDLSAPTVAQVAMTGLPLGETEERAVEFAAGRAVVLSDAVRLGESARPETALLLVPKTATDQRQYSESLAMVSVGPAVLTPRGELDGVYAAWRLDDRLHAMGHDRLHVFALDGSALPLPLASSELWPVVGNAWLVSDVIVRERLRAAGGWAEAPDVRIEAVTHEDRDPRELLGSESAAGEAQLLRAGDHIIALELFDHWGGEAPPTLRVLDFADPAQPREIGRLEDDRLRAEWNLDTDPPPLDWSWVATEDALVTRSERNADDERFGHSVFNFQIIDLREPTAPRLHDLPMPDEHYSALAVLSGKTVYYTYAIPTEESSAEQPTASYFLQTIDLSNPGAPVVSEPINVPGEVIAAGGDTVYLRDATWEDDELRHFVRRADIGTAGVRIVATRRVAGRPLHAGLTDAGDLAVTLLTAPCGYLLCAETDSELVLLSGDELQARGELALEGRCRIVGQAGDTLVVESPHHNVQLVDVSDADAPRLLRMIAPAKLVDLRGDELLYLRGHLWHPGALLRLDLAND